MSHRLSGRPLHSDRHELHGITVVLDTQGAGTYVGRFDSQDERGVHLFDRDDFDVVGLVFAPLGSVVLYVVAPILALFGLWMYDHLWIKAGQALPLS